MARQRRLVHFSGSVQGVGFRYTAAHVAAGYDLTGYVRNLPDGRVELVVEGPEDRIAAFLKDLEDRMRPYIEDASQQVSQPTGEFRSFNVRF